MLYASRNALSNAVDRLRLLHVRYQGSGNHTRVGGHGRINKTKHTHKCIPAVRKDGSRKIYFPPLVNLQPSVTNRRPPAPPKKLYYMQCWGFGNYGQLGQEDALSRGEIAGSMGDALLPVDLGTGRTAQKAVAGEGFTCVLLDNSEVVCFGRNASGQLGIGTSKDIGKEAGEMGDELVGVNFGSDFRYAVDISSGPCALLDDGAVKVSG